MIEVVFQDSAAGSLKLAKSYGKGKFRSPAMGIIHPDRQSRRKTRALMRKEKRRMRLDWKNSVPLGGNSSDVFVFSLAYSIGDITGNDITDNRLNILKELFKAYPDNTGDSAAEEIRNRVIQNLYTIRERLSSGECIRLWYSDHPDEICGLYWFISQVSQWNTAAKIGVIKLPDWETCGQMTVTHTGWGEVAPGEWHRYLNLSQEVSAEWISAVALRWREMQQENSPLRAVINGKLQSVPEDFYDGFIYQALATQDTEFSEAHLIGTILGKYQLGISDGWIAMRIENMVQNGRLLAITSAPDGSPSYHRLLRKTK